jgi:hypothetical protein
VAETVGWIEVPELVPVKVLAQELGIPWSLFGDHQPMYVATPRPFNEILDDLPPNRFTELFARGRVAVFDRVDGTLIHEPPPADQLPERLALMCRFANEVDSNDQFIHPVIRSILLHFWLAYDHPFDDGNGRTARLLFYWSMRKHGYWLTEYLTISRNPAVGTCQVLARVHADRDRRAGHDLLHHLSARSDQARCRGAARLSEAKGW